MQLAFGAAAIMAGADPKINEANMEKLIQQGLKEVTMHEVGHTLGLRHNFRASRVYTQQQTFQLYENNFALGMFSPTAFMNEDTTALARAMQLYLVDVNIQEPRLLKAYEDVLPRISTPP
jgi:predicted RNA-binding protein associated with RNAse of E/G family